MADDQLKPAALVIDDLEAEFDPIVVRIPVDDSYVRELLKFKGERPKLDFKSAFSADERRDQVEIVKDIAAMANSEGGYIILGAENDAALCGLPDAQRNAIDDSKLNAQVIKYLGQTTPLHVSFHALDRKSVVVLTVSRSTHAPLVFERDGQYGGAAPQTAFRAGDVYVRRGSSSIKWSNQEARAIYARVEQRAIQGYLGSQEGPSTAPSDPKDFADHVDAILRRPR